MIVYRDLRGLHFCKTTNFNGDAFYVLQTLHPFFITVSHFMHDMNYHDSGFQFCFVVIQMMSF